MKEIRIVLHHQKKWLLSVIDECASVFRTTKDAETAVKELGGAKFDLADAGDGIYLADISSFSCPPPSHFSLFEDIPYLFATKADKEAFLHIMDFIKSCREKLSSLLGQMVDVVIDRKIGTHHPKRPDTVYPINYGYLENILSADGEGADAYVLGVHEPIESFRGRVVAIVHRKDDIEDKLVVAPEGKRYTAEEIENAIHFQEVAYTHSLTVLN